MMDCGTTEKKRKKHEDNVLMKNGRINVWNVVRRTFVPIEDGNSNERLVMVKGTIHILARVLL